VLVFAPDADHAISPRPELRAWHASSRYPSANGGPSMIELVLLVAALAEPAPSGAPAPPAQAGHDATVHHPFDDVAKWVGVFDDPGRDAWQKPDAVIDAIGVKSGMVVADLGAGTGYFSV